MEPLIELGFWRDTKKKFEDDGRPDPRDLVDLLWYDEKSELRVVLGYLAEHSFLESYELGYSYCRFDNCLHSLEVPKIMGACNMTDGTYVWPEGYTHYLSCHGVRPPDEFISHVHRILRLQESSPTSHRQLQQWDPVTRAGIPLPKSTVDYLVEHTTLNIGQQ